MPDHLENLVRLLDPSSLTSDVSKDLIDLLHPQIQTLSPSFINDSLHSLKILERWSWQCLAQRSASSRFDDLFVTLASFNKILVNRCDQIDIETKASLILPEETDQIDAILNGIDRCDDENDPWLKVVHFWFDNLSLFILEYPQLAHTPLIRHMNHQMAEKFIFTDYFETSLKLLMPSNSSTIHISGKASFYLKTCPYSLCSYIFSKPLDILPWMKQIFQKYGQDYIKTVCLQTFTIDQWTKDLLACLTQCINSICACAFWSEENTEMMNLIFPSDTSLNEFAQALIRLIAHQSFYDELKLQRDNDTTLIFDVALFCLTNLIDRGNLRWFLRSIDDLPNILSSLVESTKCIRFTFYVYGIFGELLSEEKLKELTFTDNMAHYYFDMLEQAWKQPSRIYKQISVRSLLRSHLTLSKNAFTTQATADMKKISIFIALCDEYPMAYEIVWTLSFNTDIQQQLRTHTAFIEKLSYLAKHATDQSIRKVSSGILWNLQFHSDDPSSDVSTQSKHSFDIMISYSHKDKQLCRQLYDELIKRGYRVWIDFDQMHGNVMDAMAQAIEQSQMVIICMSEDYRRSNYCRAEAQYAFQRQRKMVPVLLQKHYKPDGWLSFVLGPLLYIDFTKHEFPKAIDMLLKELSSKTKQEARVSVTKPIVVIKNEREKKRNMKEWTKIEVQEWLVKHGFLQMSRLLIDYDGRSLFHLYRFMRLGDRSDLVKLLNEDVKHRLTETLSLIELCRWLSLIDQECLQA